MRSWTVEVTQFRYSFPNIHSCHPSKQLVNGQTYSQIKQTKKHPQLKKQLCVVHSVQQAVLGCPDSVPKASRDACWHLGAFLLPYRFDFQSHCLSSIYLCSTSCFYHNYFLLFYNFFLWGNSRCPAFLLVTMQRRYTQLSTCLNWAFSQVWEPSCK